MCANRAFNGGAKKAIAGCRNPVYWRGKPAVFREAPSARRGHSTKRGCARFNEFTLHDGSYRLRTSLGNKHEVDMSEIGERVKKIVVEHLGVEPEKVIDSASFIDDLGADSLDTVELVMAF